MSLIKFNNRNSLFPWNITELRDFLNPNDFFNDNFFTEDSFMPALNIKEHDNGFEIEFAAPGFSKNDFEITIDDNILNVSGEKSKEEDYTRKEFSYSSFKRSLKLPKSVNTDQDVRAIYKNGILKLNLQKKEEAKEQPKKVIEVL